MCLDYLIRVLAMLGEPTSTHVDPDAWRRLEGELGFEFPGDFKTITDAYAPVRLNEHLYLKHPATERWNLGEEVRGMSQAFSEIPWDDVDLEGDPRSALGISEMRFGTPDGLVPALGTDRSNETVFMAKGATGAEWRMFVNRDDEFFEYSMSFSEWLYRFLIGEDVAGPNSSAFYPGPVKFESLPMAYGEETVVWYGPDRGM